MSIGCLARALNMYTYCSHCNNQHKVSAKQLRRHRGLLLCKQCGERFDALAALTDKPDPKRTKSEGHDFIPKDTRDRSWAWRSGVVLMAAILLLQLGYFEGARFPYLHGGITAVCARLGCNAPRLSNTTDWSVSHSDLQAYLSPYYRFTAALTLQSESAQTLPQLKLTLLGFNGLPIAERVFAPEQYASVVAEATEGTREIQLWLVHPQAEVGGFTVSVL